MLLIYKMLNDQHVYFAEVPLLESVRVQVQQQAPSYLTFDIDMTEKSVNNDDGNNGGNDDNIVNEWLPSTVAVTNFQSPLSELFTVKGNTLSANDYSIMRNDNDEITNVLTEQRSALPPLLNKQYLQQILPQLSVHLFSFADIHRDLISKSFKSNQTYGSISIRGVIIDSSGLCVPNWIEQDGIRLMFCRILDNSPVGDDYPSLLNVISPVDDDNIPLVQSYDSSIGKFILSPKYITGNNVHPFSPLNISGNNLGCKMALFYVTDTQIVFLDSPDAYVDNTPIFRSYSPNGLYYHLKKINTTPPPLQPIFRLVPPPLYLPIKHNASGIVRTLRVANTTQSSSLPSLIMKIIDIFTGSSSYGITNNIYDTSNIQDLTRAIAQQLETISSTTSFYDSLGLQISRKMGPSWIDGTRGSTQPLLHALPKPFLLTIKCNVSFAIKVSSSSTLVDYTILGIPISLIVV